MYFEYTLRENPFLKKAGFPTPFPQKLWVRGGKKTAIYEFTQKTVSKFYLYDNGSNDIST